MTANGYGVESVSTRLVPAADRVDLWNGTVTAYQGALQFDYPAPERFHGRATRQRTGRFQLVTWHISQAQTIVRTARRAAADADDDFRLLLPLGPAAALRLDGADTRLADGAAVLLAGDTPYALHLPDGSRGVVLTLGRAEVGGRLGREARCARPVPLASGAGRLLAGVLHALVRERAGLTAPAFDAGCAHAVELAALVAGEPRADTGLEDLVRRVVREHAADPDLSGERVARVVGWSLRHVQAVLRRAGTTPSDLIRDTRLELARARLAGPDRRTIAAIAHASGFRTADAFERAFRRRYRSTPSAYRAAAGRA